MGSVEATLAILRLLADSNRPLGVNAIARDLSLAPSSCYKFLKVLQRADFVDFDVRTKCYTLGTGAITLARHALDPIRAFSVVRARLEDLADRLGIALGFWRRISGARIVLAGFVEGSSPLRIHMSVGQRLPVLMGAVGRAIAASSELSEVEMRLEFARLRWQSAPSFEQYLSQVQEARLQGFAVDRDNFAAGVATVAVAIHDYGLSGIMFSGQCNDEMVARVGAELLEFSSWASPRLAQ